MNVVKKIFKWGGLLFLMLAFFFIALPWFPVIKDNFASKPQKEYLSKNNVTIDLTKADGNFAFDDDFYENRLFLLGEMHGYAWLCKGASD